MMATLTPKMTHSASQGRFLSISIPSKGEFTPDGGGLCRYIFPAPGAYWAGREAWDMIKGVSRRVIVVKSPDRRFFEEAIFIVREGAMSESGVTAEQVVEEARRVADGFVGKCRRRRWYRCIPAPGYAAIGALGATVAWCIGLLL